MFLLIAEDIRTDLYKLWKYRNQWMHVNDPWDDQTLIDAPEELEEELEEVALFADQVLRRKIYENQRV